MLTIALESIVSQPVLPEWSQWVVLISGVLFAVQRVWSTIVRPVAEIITMMNAVKPILEEMATEFRPNHGSSLYDRIHRIDNTLVKHNNLLRELDSQVNPPPSDDTLEALRVVIAEIIENEMETQE